MKRVGSCDRPKRWLEKGKVVLQLVGRVTPSSRRSFAVIMPDAGDSHHGNALDPRSEPSRAR